MPQLKIAIAATLHKDLNKDANGGTEIFAYELVECLVKKGHLIDLFASKESQTAGNLQPVAERNKINLEEQGQKLFTGYQLLESQKIVEKQKLYDVIHINYYELFLFAPFSKYITKPVIYTVHSDIFESSAWQKLINSMVKPEDIFVFVSKSAMDKAKNLKNKTYIHNGINTSVFNFYPKGSDKYLWLGRIRQKKGINEAVDACIKAEVPLIVSGVMDNQVEQDFFYSKIHPKIISNPNIQFVGPASFEKKIKYYGESRAFLAPVTWEEPFGLTLIEAMACGTPVIGFAKGALPEIIVDGVTGFLVNPSPDEVRCNTFIKETGVAGLVSAIKLINNMKQEKYLTMRSNCRKHVEENFTVEKMVSGYEKVYLQILNSKS